MRPAVVQSTIAYSSAPASLTQGAMLNRSPRRNPFSYQPWRDQRTFQVCWVCRYIVHGSLLASRLCSTFSSRTLSLCKRQRSSARIYRMIWYWYQAGTVTSACRSIRKATVAPLGVDVPLLTYIRLLWCRYLHEAIRLRSDQG